MRRPGGPTRRGGREPDNRERGRRIRAALACLTLGATWISLFCGCGPTCGGRTSLTQSPPLTSGRGAAGAALI
jgi:hypothetical protein